MQNALLTDDPLWFKDAIIYEVPVRAFADSDGDGIGDFRGLTERLDYIQDLGVTAIWVLPFFPSPLRDDGYDISDYNSVNPIYGNLDDFQECLEAAHERGIRVIIELIVNHTSDQHPWFQRARRAPEGSKERDFYVWSDTPTKYPEVRIIFQDFEQSNWTWDPVTKAYFWHRFYSHQPDLNYESPEVQKAIFEVVDFWLAMGVDGLRLDAVPYLCVEEGTNCENLPDTHAFLKQLRQHVDQNFPNRMLLAEANQWPEDAVEYYGAGDECHMNFHFPLMPRLFMAIQMEDNFPLIDILQQTPHIPDNCQWALFLRNHDELTLEMVSDEDRDYMYRVYAQDTQARLNLGIRRRLAPLLGNNRRKIELMNALLMSLPGTPVLYYGDELGMGDNIYLGDRNGVRTPMQWSADRNAGFSKTNPQRLYEPIILDPEYHYEAINVETQRSNPNSLLWWMKRLIAVRKRYKAFGRGTFEFLYPDNHKVLAFLRTYRGEHLLFVGNLSRFVQNVELDLSIAQGMVPVEIFGRSEFPVISESPYSLSLSPYGFYWFSLQAKPNLTCPYRTPSDVPTLVVGKRWPSIFTQPEPKAALEALLPDYLCSCRWFTGKNRVMQNTHITEAISLTGPESELETQVVFLQVDYVVGDPETYVLYLAYEADDLESEKFSNQMESVVAQIQTTKGKGVLYNATINPAFPRLLLEALGAHQNFKGLQGTLTTSTTDVFAELCGEEAAKQTTQLSPYLFAGKQSNTSIIYGDRLLLKLFRRIEEGINPDLEMGRFLTQSSRQHGLPQPEHLVPVAGAIEYQRSKTQPITLGVLRQYVPDIRDAWSYSLDSHRDFFELVAVTTLDIDDIPMPPSALTKLLKVEMPELVQEHLGGNLLRAAELLGQRTAEFHLALASDDSNPDFAPEAFSSFYQRSLYQSMRNQSGQVLVSLKKKLKQLPADSQPLAQQLLSQKEALLAQFKQILEHKITALRTRCHSHYALEEVLYTGKDFIIIDFEGDSARPLSERRMKRSPLSDIASMLESFYSSSHVALNHELDSGIISPEQLPLMEKWSSFCAQWSGVAFLQTYLPAAKAGKYLPKSMAELQLLLNFYRLEKLISVLDYELKYHPEQVKHPLSRLEALLKL
ncbi:MAG: maltose alpha-D-glucosyltransferase [Thermosynechococcaceae cyanobacterium]